jgi:hypothetical protein
MSRVSRRSICPLPPRRLIRDDRRPSSSVRMRSARSRIRLSCVTSGRHAFVRAGAPALDDRAAVWRSRGGGLIGQLRRAGAPARRSTAGAGRRARWVGVARSPSPTRRLQGRSRAREASPASISDATFRAPS